MKIISYNVNGIRSAINKGFVEWINSANPDVLCIQEIKAYKDQINLNLFKGYYHYWFSAKKKGYSGVGILSKKKLHNIKYGIGYIDCEGRVIQADFDQISIINIYIPSGYMESRFQIKLNFMKYFIRYIMEFKKYAKKLIICGDYNICHKEIDIYDPIFNASISGFLPIEREWMTQLINLGFIDSFRFFIKDPYHYSWWSYRGNARFKNKGWRIDYNMVDNTLKNKMNKASILYEVQYSDHCPVMLDINL
ncbi:MAG: exodeoxyribonuclease III [Candidatus Bostrichicola ureolyticus]|nr:MAG: exodeoxyribonuclease III [Candidatus Bostrichicola ureolyticus]